MGKWLSYGGHDTPIVITFGRFGPQEGARWDCRCGKIHTLHAIGDTLAWDWRIEQAREEIKAEEETKDNLGPEGQTGPTIAANGARLIPHDQRQFILALADVASGKPPSPLTLETVIRVVNKMEEWGYVAFPEPVAGEQA
jgi:hypothetical protein